MSILLAVLPLFLADCPANLPICVQQYSQTFFGGTLLQEDGFNDSSNTVTVSLHINTRSVKITSAAGTQDLPRLQFAAAQYPSATVVQVALGGVFREDNAAPSTPVNADDGMFGMTKTGSSPYVERLDLHLYGGVTGAVKGDISVGRLYRFDASKEILANIESAANPANNMTIQARSLAGG